ncbi:hypothetical protein BEWA_016640 [Theileria equi strain WA]|uniref:Uncharacterized protein n=1 Tax=Theileria equi strain WA TaxID=1537102 RepID=L1L901_THEEQ|nr:hypothetical protein BEWA_016640 [Theileria equi strain WA]EKX71986.1 hypothetical protein BEWA_016640 [Theileria equi strain WA]|eukprot:XP_004831438.1 hypothetical protein BEWA_016640 [Theileria equi strain WA]
MDTLSRSDRSAFLVDYNVYVECLNLEDDEASISHIQTPRINASAYRSSHTHGSKDLINDNSIDEDDSTDNGSTDAIDSTSTDTGTLQTGTDINSVKDDTLEASYLSDKHMQEPKYSSNTVNARKRTRAKHGSYTENIYRRKFLYAYGTRLRNRDPYEDSVDSADSQKSLENTDQPSGKFEYDYEICKNLYTPRVFPSIQTVIVGESKKALTLCRNGSGIFHDLQTGKVVTQIPKYLYGHLHSKYSSYDNGSSNSFAKGLNINEAGVKNVDSSNIYGLRSLCTKISASTVNSSPLVYVGNALGDVHVLDLRIGCNSNSGLPILSLNNCHTGSIVEIYNFKRNPFSLFTCGFEDGYIRFFDIRYPHRPHSSHSVFSSTDKAERCYVDPDDKKYYTRGSRKPRKKGYYYFDDEYTDKDQLNALYKRSLDVLNRADYTSNLAMPFRSFKSFTRIGTKYEDLDPIEREILSNVKIGTIYSTSVSSDESLVAIGSGQSELVFCTLNHDIKIQKTALLSPKDEIPLQIHFTDNDSKVMISTYNLRKAITLCKTTSGKENLQTDCCQTIQANGQKGTIDDYSPFGLLSWCILSGRNDSWKSLSQEVFSQNFTFIEDDMGECLQTDDGFTDCGKSLYDSLNVYCGEKAVERFRDRQRCIFTPKTPLKFGYMDDTNTIVSIGGNTYTDATLDILNPTTMELEASISTPETRGMFVEDLCYQSSSDGQIIVLSGSVDGEYANKTVSVLKGINLDELSKAHNRGLVHYNLRC